MKNLLVIFIVFVATPAQALSQLAYTDNGHWIGLRAGLVPAGSERGLNGTALNEYRFHRNLSMPLELTGLQFTSGFSIGVNVDIASHSLRQKFLMQQ